MKILHFITLSELGGAQSVLLNLAKKSIEDGDEVIVVSSENGDLWDQLPSSVIKVKIPKLFRAIGLKDISVFFQLLKINRRYKPDVVHLHSSKAGALGRLAFPKKKIVYTVHGFDSIRIGFRKFLHLEKILQHRCSAIVTVSQYDRKNMELEGITKNLQVIYNGTEDYARSSTLNLDSDDLEPIKKLKLSNKKIVISIARLSKPKRFDMFLNLAKSFIKDDSLHFVWVGNKQLPIEPLPKNIYMAGELKDAARALAYSDVFVLFSDYEGMPISIIEALNFGLPIIASNVGGVSEMVNESNGQLVDNNTKNLAEKLSQTLQNDKKMRKMDSNSRKTYEKLFTINDMYSKYKKLYLAIHNP